MGYSNVFAQIKKPKTPIKKATKTNSNIITKKQPVVKVNTPLQTLIDNTPKVKDIYIYGDLYNDNTRRSRPQFWKNGILTDTLYSNNGNKNQLYYSPTTDSIYRNGVAVELYGNLYKYYLDGPNFYALSNDQNGRQSVLRINDSIIYLGAEAGYAVNFAIIGKDVYVLLTGLRLWKNGVITYLVDFTKKSESLRMYSTGTDVFVMGTEAGVLKYWKNGIAHNLPTQIINNGYDNFSLFNDFLINDTDEYVVVYLTGENESQKLHYAAYWKNGVLNKLPTSKTYSEAKAIAINGTDVYLIGTQWEKNSKIDVIYWKNGIRIELESPNEDNLSSTGKTIYIK
jgi:hypothetical protein